MKHFGTFQEKKGVKLFGDGMPTGGEGVKLSGDGMPTGGEGGSNILKSLTTSFMDGPLRCDLNAPRLSP